MDIKYRETRSFGAGELQELFLFVEWSSGHYPEKLVVAMENSASVFSAWHNGKLVCGRRGKNAHVYYFTLDLTRKNNHKKIVCQRDLK